jgi:hypothetical protein
VVIQYRPQSAVGVAMMTTIALECDAAIADELATKLKGVVDGEIDIAEKDNLDGSLATVLQIFQVATPFITAVAPIIVTYLKRVKKIKIGDVEIENATAEDLKQLLARSSNKNE